MVYIKGMILQSAGEVPFRLEADNMKDLMLQAVKLQCDHRSAEVLFGESNTMNADHFYHILAAHIQKIDMGQCADEAALHE